MRGSAGHFPNRQEYEKFYVTVYHAHIITWPGIYVGERFVKQTPAVEKRISNRRDFNYRHFTNSACTPEGRSTGFGGFCMKTFLF